MALGLLGKKIGMTQIYDGDLILPVTVIHAGPNVVLRHRTLATDKYSAVQLGFDDKKPSRVNKPDTGQYALSGATPKKFVKEMRLPADPGEDLSVGKELGVTLFTVGQKLDVTGTSKGKGFQGVMKRHHFKGCQTTSHGTHEYKRHSGSIGQRLTPGRTFKGMRMGGQMGNEQVTVMNLEVKKIDVERNLLYIGGAVPGCDGSYLTVRPTKKTRLGPGGGPRIIRVNAKDDKPKGNKNKK